MRLDQVTKSIRHRFSCHGHSETSESQVWTDSGNEGRGESVPGMHTKRAYPELGTQGAASLFHPERLWRSDGAVPQRHAMTCDVEDYFQVSAFEHLVSRASWDRME